VAAPAAAVGKLLPAPWAFAVRQSIQVVRPRQQRRDDHVRAGQALAQHEEQRPQSRRDLLCAPACRQGAACLSTLRTLGRLSNPGGLGAAVSDASSVRAHKGWGLIYGSVKPISLLLKPA
jgi:hypothetical protein